MKIYQHSTKILGIKRTESFALKFPQFHSLIKAVQNRALLKAFYSK